MNRLRAARRRILPTLLVLAVGAAAAGFLLSRGTALPENPLEQPANAAHMLLPGGGTLPMPDASHAGETASAAPDTDATQTGTPPAAEAPTSSAPARSDAPQPDSPAQPDRSETPSASSGEPAHEPGGTGGESDPTAPGDDPAFSGDQTDEQYFTTSLRDGETVPSRSLSFTITHLQKQLTVLSESVWVNGTAQPQFGGRVLLNAGKNLVRVAAKYRAPDGKTITAFRDYIIYVGDEADALTLRTSLIDCTVHESSIDFTASVQGGSSRARLTVVANGVTLTGSGSYTAPLQIGDNVIRLKATDRRDGKPVTVDRLFYVKYVPLADAHTAPVLKDINVSDGMSVTGSEFTLNVNPADYLGNRIYANGITVQLNGLTYDARWTSEFTSYLLWFNDGENRLCVRITDSDGRFTDYSYTVYCRIPQAGESLGTLTFCMDANVLGLGYLIPPQKVEIRQGESGADLLCRVLHDNGFDFSNSGTTASGFYLARVYKAGVAANVSIPTDLVEEINADGLEWKAARDPDSLGEFDYCQGSGWMYCINESYVGFGTSDAVFRDNDFVRVRFTLAYGKDIGGCVGTGGGNENYAKTW